MPLQPAAPRLPTTRYHLPLKPCKRMLEIIEQLFGMFAVMTDFSLPCAQHFARLLVRREVPIVPTRLTLTRKWARQKLPSLMAKNGNACTTCAYLSPTPGFFATFYYYQCLCPYGQRCSDTNDVLFERRVVPAYNVYLHILCMIEPGKGMRFSSSVKHLHNMHLSTPSPQIHLGWTIDGRSKKGRFKHTLYFGTLHVYLRSAYACA